MEYLESAPKSHVQTEPPCFPVLKVFCAWVANLLRGLSKVFLASTGISFKQILGALPINQQPQNYACFASTDSQQVARPWAGR